MKVLGKLVRWLLLAIIFLAIVVVVFLWSPWSDHPPHRGLSLFWEDKRVHNLRNMDEVFPSVPIKASSAPFTLEQDNEPKEELLQATYTVDGNTKTVAQGFEDLQVSSFLVLKDDKIVFEQYRLGGDAESRFTSWSVAKSFVSTLIGMAVDEGKIASVNDAVEKYVPELAGTSYEGILIKDVLQMSSGIDFDETYGDRFSDVQQFFFKVFFFGSSPDDTIPTYGRLEHGPGTKFKYSSIDTQVLGYIARKVYGKSVPELVEEKIVQPLGMQSAYWNVNNQDDKIAIAFCCLNMRTRDYAKFGRLFLNQGEWQGKQIISKQWVRDATTASEPHLQPGVAREHRGYGYQWWLPLQPQREYLAAGVWGQYIYVSEPDNLVIVRTSVDPDYMTNMAESVAMLRAVRDALK